MYIDNHQKLELREKYRKDHNVKVSNKVMNSLTINEFEEYLKRRLQQQRAIDARKVLKRYLLGFAYKLRFKKVREKRHKMATVIQRWFREKYV